MSAQAAENGTLRCDRSRRGLRGHAARTPVPDMACQAAVLHWSAPSPLLRRTSVAWTGCYRVGNRDVAHTCPSCHGQPFAVFATRAIVEAGLPRSWQRWPATRRATARPPLLDQTCEARPLRATLAPSCQGAGPALSRKAPSEGGLTFTTGLVRRCARAVRATVPPQVRVASHNHGARRLAI